MHLSFLLRNFPFRLLLLPLAQALVIPTGVPGLKYNDYGLAEARWHEEAKWASAGTAPERHEKGLDEKESGEKPTTSCDPDTTERTIREQLIDRTRNERRAVHYIRRSDSGRVYVDYPEELQQRPRGNSRGGFGKIQQSPNNRLNIPILGNIESISSDEPISTISRRETNDEPCSPQPYKEPTLPSMGDWWAIDGPKFLRTYVVTFGESDFTAKHGLFGGLVHCYGLGLETNATQTDECVQVQKALGTADSEKALFALTALKHFINLTDLVHDSIGPAFREAGKMIEELSYTKNWWKTYPSANKSQLAVDSIKAAFRNVILSELPWKTEEAWKAETDKLHLEASKKRKGAKLANAEPGAKSFSLNKWDQLFGTNVELKDLDRARSSPGYNPAMGIDNVGVTAAAERGVAYADKLRKISQSAEFVRSGELSWNITYGLLEALGEKSVLNRKAIAALGSVSVSDYLGATAQLGQRAFQETMSGFFNGSLQLDIYRLLEFGNFLGTDADRIAAHRDVLPRLMKRMIYYKFLNEALLSDYVYVTCTVDKGAKPYQFGGYSNSGDCAKDHSGPQDLKACVEEGDVCYMYRWMVPPRYNILPHNCKPLGIEEWTKTPFHTNASDIIISSVNGALNGLRDFRLQQDNTPQLIQHTSSIADVADASSPGVFSLPVCYSDYSWNTPLHTTRRSRKWWQPACSPIDPYCYEKVPPCYCGPWGSQTMSVWDRIGFAKVALDHGNTERGICAGLIKKKIKNPLEAYVAYCRLGIRRTFSWTGSRVNGWVVDKSRKDKHCEEIIRILEQREYGAPEDIEPDVKYAIYCKILGDGKRCKMYKSLWKELITPAVVPTALHANTTQETNEEIVEYESEFARLVLGEEKEGEERDGKEVERE